jgi:hypothetical protein
LIQLFGVRRQSASGDGALNWAGHVSLGIQSGVALTPATALQNGALQRIVALVRKHK